MPARNATDVELRHRERVERVGERDRADEQEPTEVGRDHRLPPPPAPVDERTGVEGEEQVRHERGGAEVAHLRGVRIEHEHRRQRQCDGADLVAEERDSLAEPEAAEPRLAQERGQGRSLSAWRRSRPGAGSCARAQAYVRPGQSPDKSRMARDGSRSRPPRADVRRRPDARRRLARGGRGSPRRGRLDARGRARRSRSTPPGTLSAGAATRASGSARTSTPCRTAATSTACSGSSPASSWPSGSDVPFAVVAFRDEERGCAGSSACAAAGRLPEAYLELHVEQGPVLERANEPIGIVTAIAGIARGEVVFEGRADHAGTTPMDVRDGRAARRRRVRAPRRAHAVASAPSRPSAASTSSPGRVERRALAGRPLGRGARRRPRRARPPRRRARLRRRA